MHSQESPLLFFFSSLAFIALYGMLMVANVESKIWRRGIFFGAAGAGYSAIGFVAPIVNPVPCFAFIFSMLVMLCAVLLSYYKQPIPDTYQPDQVSEIKEQRTIAITRMSFGLGFVLFVSAIVGFTSGQEDGRELTGSFARVVYQLSKEVNTLHDAVDNLRKEIKVIREKQKADTKSDSVALSKILTNQKVLLKNKR